MLHYYTTGQTQYITTNEVYGWIVSQLVTCGKNWSPTVTTKVARGMLATLRDFDVLEGIRKKRIAPVYLPIESVAYIAFALSQEGVSGLQLVEKMRTAQLPGVQSLEELQETIMGILGMPTDDCVKTLAGEGKSYQEARARAQRLHDVLTLQNLQLLRSARRALDMQYPILKAHEPSEEAAKADAELRTALESEWFYEHLEVIRRATTLLRSRYQELYRQFHQERHATYFEAIDEIKGLPEWGQVADWVKSTADLTVQEERRHRLEIVLSRLANKICDIPNPSETSEVCSQCHATIAQMESDIAAVETLKSHAIRELQELAAPEKKIVRVRVSSVLGSIVETPEDVEQAVDRLKEHLLKWLAEDTRTRIVLE